MKKLYCFLFFIILSINLTSSNLTDYLDSSKFYYSLNSFVGSDYYPVRISNTFRYFDKHIFKTGWSFKADDNIEFWFELSCENELFDKKIILEKTGISYNKNNWNIKYLIDNIEYGKSSQIFQQSVNNKYFDEPTITNYRFNGAEVTFNKKNVLSFSARCGGNDFNTSIFNTSFIYRNNNYKYELFYLYTGRDKDYNLKMHSGGVEFFHKFGSFSVYGADTYQKSLKESNHNGHEEILSLIELIFNLNENLQLGTNFLYENLDWGKEETWQNQSFIKCKIKHFKSILSYRYNKTDLFEVGEIALIPSFRISEKWLFGGFASYLNFNLNNDDYYIIGIQTKFNYETD
ncbi:MAG: hypothetical protein KAU01_02865 [Candidatus Cloacimonetes bacterium]|nr:hypothetical protein [Candidatus Cloacimonadota bacterium]